MEKMILIDKEEFLSRLKNPERAFLVEKDSDGLYLIADMEIVDEFCGIPPVRSETMCFLLEESNDFLYEAVECRTRYCGGILIDDNEGKSREEIYNEFLEIDGKASYIYCSNDLVKNIAKELQFGFSYLIFD